MTKEAESLATSKSAKIKAEMEKVKAKIADQQAKLTLKLRKSGGINITTNE